MAYGITSGSFKHIGQKYRSIKQDHPGSEVGIWIPQEESNLTQNTRYKVSSENQFPIHVPWTQDKKPPLGIFISSTSEVPKLHPKYNSFDKQDPSMSAYKAIMHIGETFWPIWKHAGNK